MTTKQKQVDKEDGMLLIALGFWAGLVLLGIDILSYFCEIGRR